jgi:hypothetical protein
MSEDVAFSLATSADDAGIRRLLSSNPIPGKIRIRYEREDDRLRATISKADGSDSVTWSYARLP